MKQSMTDFTQVFLVLDPTNKGYVLIDDFRKAMYDFLTQNNSSNADETENSFKRLLSLINPSLDGKVSYDDFVAAVNKLKDEDNLTVTDSEDDIKFSDSSPFVNEYDNYSNGDSGLDVESRTGHEFSNSYGLEIGKRNRRLIKNLQNSDANYDYGIRRNLSDSENFNGNLDLDLNHKGSLHQLPCDDSKTAFKGKRRQSDFVTCGISSARRSNDGPDDETGSYACWTPCGGSVANLCCYDSMSDIQKKLEKLEQSMDNLQTTTNQTKFSKRRHVESSKFLLTQIQNLEDKLKEQRKQFEKDLCSERENAKKVLQKLEQTKSEETESLVRNLKKKTLEADVLRKELNVVMGECEKLKYEKLRSEDRLGDLQQQMNYIEEDMKRVKDFHSREMDLLIREKNCLIHQSGKYQMSSTSMDLSDEFICDEIAKLKQENLTLRRKLEETEAEILTLSVHQGQSVLQSISNDNSWMSEIDGYTKEELIDLLVKEKDSNFRLREYINGILMRIIDRDPTLLEIP